MKPISLLGCPISLADAVTPVSQAQARGVCEQTAQWWQKAAQGKISVATSIAAPIYVSEKKLPTGSAARLPNGDCNIAAWTYCNDALKAARAAGFNGQTPVYFFQHVNCRGHGNATTNTPIYMHGATGLQVLAHEYGHTVQLQHDWSLKMSDAHAPFDPVRARATEYGEPYCVMGTGLSWLCPIHAFRLGVRPAPKRIPLATRTMFIKQTGQPDDSGAPRGVQVTRGGPPGYTYQLTYQSPTNLNQVPVKDRIVPVRLVGGLHSYYLAGLKAGKSWDDPLGGVKFTMTGETADGWAIVEMVAS